MAALRILSICRPIRTKLLARSGRRADYRRSGFAAADPDGRALEAKVPLGKDCCGCDDSDHPVKNVQTLFIYDVAQQWREMTGLPCVLAIWVARRGLVTPEIVADFQASREYGSLARIA